MQEMQIYLFLLRQVQEKVLPLPPARGLLEEDYQSLVQALCRDRARLAMEMKTACGT